MEVKKAVASAEEGLEPVNGMRGVGQVAEGELEAVGLGAEEGNKAWRCRYLACRSEVMGITGVADVELSADPRGLGITNLDESAECVAGVVIDVLAAVVGSGDILGEDADSTNSEVDPLELTIESAGSGGGLCVGGWGGQKSSETGG